MDKSEDSGALKTTTMFLVMAHDVSGHHGGAKDDEKEEYDDDDDEDDDDDDDDDDYDVDDDVDVDVYYHDCGKVHAALVPLCHVSMYVLHINLD